MQTKKEESLIFACYSNTYRRLIGEAVVPKLLPPVTIKNS